MLSNWFTPVRTGIRYWRSDSLIAPGARNLLPETSASGGIRWSSLALGGVVAGVLIVVTVITVLSFVGNDKLSLLISAATVHPHESTAEWVGDDAMGYASINLRPGLSELLRARDLFNNIVDFDQADTEFDNGIDELSERLGIDVRDGVLPVLGPELAVAAYAGNDPFFDEPGVVFFAGFLDMGVGRSIVDAYVAKTEREGEMIELMTIGGLETYYLNEEIYVTVHDSEPYVLIASTQGVLERTLSMMETPVNPLSEDPEFIAAMDQLPDKRFVSGYANLSQFTAVGFDNTVPGSMNLQPNFGIFPFGVGVDGTSPESQVIAGAATIGKKDMRIDYVFTVDPETYVGVAPPSAVLDLVPGEVIGFFSMGGLQLAIDQMLELFDGEGLDSDLNSEFTEQTGLDLETDLLDPIGKEIAVVLIDLENGGPPGSSILDSPPRIAAALIVELDDVGRMDATMDRIREIAAESDVNFTAVDVAGEPAWLALTPKESPPLELAYMLTDGFFVGGISLDSLERVKMTADGDLDSVKDNDAYRRALDTVGDDALYTFFLEFEPLSKAVRSFIDPDDLPEFDERLAPWFEKIESFALTTSVDEAWVSTTMLLTIN